jgi:hypothetical protein
LPHFAKTIGKHPRDIQAALSGIAMPLVLSAIPIRAQYGEVRLITNGQGGKEFDDLSTTHFPSVSDSNPHHTCSFENGRGVSTQ